MNFIKKIIVLSLLVTLASSKVIELNEENWAQLLDGEWMVEFMAPWCPACKNLESIWSDFGSWSNDLSIKVAKIDVVKNPGLSGRFFVTALPTIYHVTNGNFRKYSGTRDMNAFMSFVEDKKWQSLEVISGWKRPDGIPMGILSWFFRLSHFLKELNNTLLTEYGLPTWMSYGLFAIATIILGAIVGLILVCIIDFIWPQKPLQRQTFTEVQEKEKLKKSQELINEDLVDDTLDQEEEEESDTSDAEKNSGSDEEDEEADKPDSDDDEEEEEEIKEPTPKSSPDVRKRRTRKAD